MPGAYHTRQAKAVETVVPVHRGNWGTEQPGRRKRAERVTTLGFGLHTTDFLLIQKLNVRVLKPQHMPPLNVSV